MFGNYKSLHILHNTPQCSTTTKLLITLDVSGSTSSLTPNTKQPVEIFARADVFSVSAGACFCGGGVGDGVGGDGGGTGVCTCQEDNNWF